MPHGLEIYYAHMWLMFLLTYLILNTFGAAAYHQRKQKFLWLQIIPNTFILTQLKKVCLSVCVYMYLYLSILRHPTQVTYFFRLDVDCIIWYIGPPIVNTNVTTYLNCDFLGHITAAPNT